MFSSVFYQYCPYNQIDLIFQYTSTLTCMRILSTYILRIRCIQKEGGGGPTPQYFLRSCKIFPTFHI